MNYESKNKNRESKEDGGQKRRCVTHSPCHTTIATSPYDPKKTGSHASPSFRGSSKAKCVELFCRIGWFSVRYTRCGHASTAAGGAYGVPFGNRTFGEAARKDAASASPGKLCRSMSGGCCFFAARRESPTSTRKTLHSGHGVAPTSTTYV